jgi:hypothetical protein
LSLVSARLRAGRGRVGAGPVHGGVWKLAVGDKPAGLGQPPKEAVPRAARQHAVVGGVGRQQIPRHAEERPVDHLLRFLLGHSVSSAAPVDGKSLMRINSYINADGVRVFGGERGAMARSATFGAQPDAAALLTQAAAETGLRDFGDGQFRGALDAFARLLNSAGRLNSAGQLGADDKRAAFGQMVGVLGWRLRLVEDRKRYPGITDERIEAPLIVVGFPRSGTTLLHALLAQAPGNRAPLYWEIARPSPPPSLAPPGDPRIAAGTRDIERWLADYAGFIAQHPYFDAGGETPMECESLLVYDLRSAYPTLFGKVPYGQPWTAEGTDEQHYATHRQLLQHLQFGAPRRRWVLKGVEHQFRLSALLAAYPDAKLVWPHRDPLEVFGSLLAVISMVFRHSGAPVAADPGVQPGRARPVPAAGGEGTGRPGVEQRLGMPHQVPGPGRQPGRCGPRGVRALPPAP